MPFLKRKIDVKVPKFSGADMSHRNSGSLTCGTITPVLVEEVIPASKVSLRMNVSAQLPPLASDTYMNCRLAAEAFFVPFRLCCASFSDFFCDFPKRVVNFSAITDGASGQVFSDVKGAVPVFELASTTTAATYGPCTLLDYLGFKVSSVTGATKFNALSLIAYHLIWQEYYRNPKVQNPAFAPDLGAMASSANSDKYRIAALPYKYFHRAYNNSTGSYPDNTVIQVSTDSIAQALKCADGTSIFNLRQRNFGFDFFTCCRPSAQQGAAVSVNLDADGNGVADTSVTIAAIRAANSLQLFRERNGIPSPRMVDQVAARYGANLSDGVAQRPICIGSAKYDFMTRGVDQTAAASSSGSPFTSVGNQYGRAYGVGSDFIIDNFVANEPGLIMVNLTLVPEVTYESGISPYLMRYVSDGSIVEMANPLLQNVGDEPVSTEYLMANSGSPQVFGFNDRYGTFMYHSNECHGLLRANGSLSSFVLTRGFVNQPAINSAFLEIPTNYLDGIFAVGTEVSGFSAWYDIKHDWHISMPLAESSIPSLQDPAYEHGRSVILYRNGQIF